ncbi:hypothetical protein [Legionella brunensis]|uniref:Uncharacterized protein n=1 Tax=Legionella brunensis TaxID=29422 RepID=A0A0W0S3A5_9GAMM|nr:hypothetical protein [Legionella brunensis]KTC77896.1 hypothetical protein Lbru_2789 [Legionella brunensis]
MTNENLVIKALKLVWDEGKKFNEKYIPGFFAPYRSPKDAALSLSAPIYAPLLLGFLTAAIATVTLLAAIISAAAYVTAGAARLLGKQALFHNAIDIGEFCGIITAVAAILIPCAAILTVASLPLSIAHLFTRAGASVVSAVSDCCSSEPPPVDTNKPLAI